MCRRNGTSLKVIPKKTNTGEKTLSFSFLGGSSAKSYMDVSRLGKGGNILLLKEEKSFRGHAYNTVSVLQMAEENRVHGGFT